MVFFPKRAWRRSCWLQIWGRREAGKASGSAPSGIVLAHQGWECSELGVLYLSPLAGYSSLGSNSRRTGTFKRPPFHCACARAGSPAGLPPTPRPPRPGASTCSKRERTDRPTRPGTVLQSRDVGLKQATRPRSCARMVTATPQRRTIARHGPRWTPSLMGNVQSPRDDRWR